MTQDDAESIPIRAASPAEFSPPTTPSIADGVRRSLDPQFVPLQRVVGMIVTAVLSFGLLVGSTIVWLTGELPRWGNFLLLPAWVVVTVGLAWLSYIWPPIEMRHISYVVDDEGIEIGSGVWWRAVTNVPRSRVQHIDVLQGPLERSYGLGRLVIFTAGTEHSRVELPGLNHQIAYALRNHLLPRGSDDAV
jgi:membrane protein YdbS with pleckstrin-like domain